jgi:hypothetical protein
VVVNLERKRYRDGRQPVSLVHKIECEDKFKTGIKPPKRRVY